MSEEEKGFQVKDRRAFSQEGDLKENGGDGRDEPEAPPVEEAPPEPEARAEAENRVLPPVDFPSFVLSLGHAALLHMGQVPDPGTGQANQDLELARHTIDTLGMLQEKTKGNLSDEEKNLIDNILTELRLAFVRLNK